MKAHSSYSFFFLVLLLDGFSLDGVLADWLFFGGNWLFSGNYWLLSGSLRFGKLCGCSGFLLGCGCLVGKLSTAVAGLLCFASVEIELLHNFKFLTLNLIHALTLLDSCSIPEGQVASHRLDTISKVL